MCSLSAASRAGEQIYNYIGAPALSTSNLDIGEVGGGKLFEVRFQPGKIVDPDGTLIDNPNAFQGDLIARGVLADGSFPPDVALWQAKDTTTAQSSRGSSDNRIIITSSDDGFGRRFWWDSSNGDSKTLTNDMKDQINSATAPGTTPDPVTDWTRGYDNNEDPTGAQYRQRNTVLGNLVHGTPAYLGPPHQFFSDNNYGDFSGNFASREPLVFIGGGDAMMHAFKASDGTEVFAYIPREFLSALQGLTDQTTEIFLVDGSPTTGDAYGPFPFPSIECAAGDCWRTILVSGLGVGGRTIFALDVTNPVDDIGSGDTATKESNAADLYLWEFTHADLGLTTADPLIAQLSDGTWVAIFGNGREAGNTALFVVNLVDGTLIQEIVVSSSGDGLSSPVVWNTGNDTVKTAYAGDLEGNLWKFDFSKASLSCDPEDQKPAVCASIAFSDSPLITVSDEITGNFLPITTRPLVSTSPTGGELLVYFGTGNTDQNSGVTNALFGIQDKGNALGTDPELLESVVVDPILYQPPGEPGEPLPTKKKYRVIREGTAPDSPDGWKLVLPPGERILTNPILGNGRVGFTSTDPVIETFNQNWFTAVDFLTGGPPDPPFLDLNGDGDFDNDDLLQNINGCEVDEPDCEDLAAPAVGIFLDVGVVSGPTPANIAGKKDTVYITHGLESLFNSPWLEVLLLTNPGIKDGHIDHDTFLTENGSKRDHTHEYDDKYNVNGVNMRVSGGEMLNPLIRDSYTGGPEPLSFDENATGMMSGDKALMDNVLRTADGDETMVYLEIVNPYSYDSAALLQQRCDIHKDFIDPGPDCPPELDPLNVDNIAPPVRIWYQCETSPDGVEPPVIYEFEGTAVEFNDITKNSVANRTCKARKIKQLISKVPDINALRAMVPGCARNGTEYDIPDDSVLYPSGDGKAQLNSGYRGGAFTMRARVGNSTGTKTDGTVFHEDSIYEHITPGTTLLVPLISESGRATSSLKCDAINEDLRAFRDPDAYPPDDGTNVITETGEDPTETITSGTQLTETINVNQTQLKDGRVSWREVLQ